MGSQLAAQDKRKEKARIAARARRSQEASIIMEMANELHITQEKVRKIDKATIVKLAIDYIKAFEILCRFRGANTSSSSSNNNSNSNSNSIGNNNTCESLIYNPTSCCSSGIGSGSDSNDESSLTQVQEQQQQQAENQQQQVEQQQRRQERSPDSRVTRKRPHLQPFSLIPPPQQQQQQQQLMPLPPPSPQAVSAPPSISSSYSAPKLSTSSIFAPRTDDMDSFFLLIKQERDGKASFVLKPDTEVAEEDDLSHLAPQAGDVSISLDVEPLEGIVLDTGLFGTTTLSTPTPIPTPAPTEATIANENNCSMINRNNNNNRNIKKTPMLTAKDLIETCCINISSIGTVEN